MQSEVAEDALDAEIDKYIEKVEVMQSKPQSRKTEKSEGHPGKHSVIERQTKDKYIKSVFTKKSPAMMKSNVSDRSKLSKVRFADQNDEMVADHHHTDHTDIFDAVEGAGKHYSVCSDEASEEDPPIIVPPRKKAYIDLSFKDSKFQKRERRLRDEEQLLFGLVQESSDDQSSQISQFSQLRSETHSMRYQMEKRQRPASAQIKNQSNQVHGINASRF